MDYITFRVVHLKDIVGKKERKEIQREMEKQTDRRTLFLSVSVSLYFLFLFLSISLPLSLFLFLCFSLYLFLFLSISLSLFPILSVSIIVSLSLLLSVSLVYGILSICLSLFLSIFRKRKMERIKKMCL